MADPQATPHVTVQAEDAQPETASLDESGVPVPHSPSSPTGGSPDHGKY